MKKLLVVVVVMITLCVLFYLKTSHSDDVIVIGVIGDYSTRTSTGSIDAFRAIELAAEELNSKEILYELKRFNLAEYEDEALFKKDLKKMAVDVLIGPSSSSEFLNARHILEKLDIPVFLNAVSTNAINETDDNFFRITSSVEIQVDSMWQAAIEYLNMENINVYYTTSNMGYSKPFATDLVDKLKPKAGKIELIEVGDLSSRDVQNVLIKEIDSKSVIVIAGSGQAGIIAQMISKKNPDAAFLFPSWAQSDQTLEFVEKLEQDMYIVASPEMFKEKSYGQLTALFMDEKGISMNPSSFFGYEIMYFTHDVLSKVDSVTLDEVKDYVHHLDVYSSPYNDYKFNDYGDGARGYSLMKIVDGEYVLEMKLIEWEGYND